MTEQMQPSEMDSQNEQPAQTSAEMTQISAAELAEIRAALKKANGEAAKYRKTAEQIEQERKAKEEAEMTALQKAEARAKELEAQLNQERRMRLQNEVAAKAGLPAVLASRLHGETPEEMEADAQAILEALPKPQSPTPEKSKAPGIAPTNPGGAAVAETDAQKRVRLLGGGVNIFDADVQRSRGGGGFVVEK